MGRQGATDDPGDEPPFSEQAHYDELALSQWGIWADELDPIALEQLATAYFQRKRWEAELQAGWIIRLLAQAMGGDSGAPGDKQRVAPDALLAEMGISL